MSQTDADLATTSMLFERSARVVQLAVAALDLITSDTRGIIEEGIYIGWRMADTERSLVDLNRSLKHSVRGTSVSDVVPDYQMMSDEELMSPGPADEIVAAYRERLRCYAEDIEQARREVRQAALDSNLGDGSSITDASLRELVNGD